MSMIQEAKEDLKTIKTEYVALDSKVRFIDKVSFALLLVFAINFILISINSDIVRTPANVFLMMLPLFMAAIVFSFRGKAKEGDIENFKKDFSIMTGGLLVLTLITLIVHWS